MGFTSRATAIASVLVLFSGACGNFGSDGDDPQTQQPSGPEVDNGDAGRGPDVGGEPAADSFLFGDAAPRTWLMVGNTTKVPFTIKRGKGFTAPVTVTATELPDGIAAKPVMITQDSGELEITVPAGATQGPLEITISGAGGAANATSIIHAFVRGLPGTVDPTFGQNGVVEVPVDGTVAASDIIVTPDDSIIALGTCNISQGCLVRLLADGSVDPTFDRTYLPTAFGRAGTRMTLQPDGKILVPLNLCGIARLTPLGKLDPDFGNSGTPGITSLKPSFGTPAQCQDLLLRPDGGILAVYDQHHVGSKITVGVARLSPTGAVVTTFGTQGYTENDFGDDQSSSSGAVLRADGKIVTAGSAIPTFLGHQAIRLDGDTGALDTTFGTNGRWSLATPSKVSRIGLIALPTGSIVVPMAVGTEGKLVALRENGEGLDTSFGVQGAITIPNEGSYDAYPKSYVRQPDGKILVCRGGPGDNAALLRFNSDGSLDSSFGTGGKVPGTNPSIVRLQSDGRILVNTGAFHFTRYWN